MQFGLPSGQWGRSGPWKEAVDNFDHSSSCSLLYRRCTQCWLHVGGEGIERWRSLQLGTEWGRQLVCVPCSEEPRSGWPRPQLKKWLAVCVHHLWATQHRLRLSRRRQCGRSMFWGQLCVVFSKGPILRKAHQRRRTRSCFIALAGSLPFFPPWVWHLGSPAVVWRPLSWGGWALMMIISAFYLPSEGRLAMLRPTHHSEPSLEVCARRTSLLTYLMWLEMTSPWRGNWPIFNFENPSFFVRVYMWSVDYLQVTWK